MRSSSRSARTAAAALVVLAPLSCGEAPDGDARGPVALTSVRTLITTESGRIGGVYDLDVAPDGSIYLADYGFKHVLVVRPGGAIVGTIGSEGSGPGEFQMPYTVRAGVDSVRVLDARTSLVQVFEVSGTLARSYRLETPGLGGGRAFGEDGRLAAAVDGFEETMVLVLDAEGRRVASVGEPLVPATGFFDFTAIKAEIRDGRIPDALRNAANVSWGPDDAGVYLVFTAEPEVRRYDGAGDLLWSRTLEEPVLAAARQRFIDRNIAEQNPARLHPLRYVTDVRTVGGDLWLLLATADEEEGLLLVLDAADGSIRQRFTFPGLPNTGPFAVDASRGVLYMAPRDEAALVAFDLPSD